ncbi:MAG: hypothetical protein RLZ12_263 [Bacillota bacterium]|jgi:predicted AAA+ superfamily ATPase
MFRRAMYDLLKWKANKYRKPLIIKGARQVGKTWLMKRFGQDQYDKYAYINFDHNVRMQGLFRGNLSIGRLITALQIEADIKIEAANTLLIFDEIQEVPEALTSLKYFYEQAPEYHIVAAGSLLGVALHPGTSFPVGKVDFLELYPLDFLEFMQAQGEAQLVELINKHDFELVTTFKSRYIDLLKSYYYIGGMPEAVNIFSDTKDYTEVRAVQNKLLQAYEQDFSKHAPQELVPRLRMLWNSLPTQLAKENRKFIYGLIREGARAREYELALQWLGDCGLAYKVTKVTKPALPLQSYLDYKAFKIYFLDVGLLSAFSQLDLKTVLEGNKIFEEFKGALTEQYVLQQLVTQTTPFYWTAKKGTAEIDFILQGGSQIVPLEVKAEENLQAKSLKHYCQKYKPKLAIRSSLSDYRREDWLTNLPLYAINIIMDQVYA